jgi:hypothetical protein
VAQISVKINPESGSVLGGNQQGKLFAELGIKPQYRRRFFMGRRNQGEEIANDPMSAGCDQAERPASAFESNMREVILQPGVRRSIFAR